MLSKLRLRLIRILNSGADVDTLLEEIISELGDDDTRADFPGGLELKSTADKPAIQIDSDPTNVDDSAPLIRITRGGTDIDIDLSTDGNIEQPTAGSGSASAATTPLAFPGVIVSGTGATYQANIYLNGLSGAATTVTVTQLQISSSETIPVGTSCLVVKSGSNYYAQIPVWL